MKINKYSKKDGSTVYRASVYLGIDTVTGKKIKTTVSGRTKTEVKQKARQAELDFIKGGSTTYREATADVKTFGELAQMWLESYRLTVRPQTYKGVSSRLDREILPTFGRMKLDKISPAMVQKFANQHAQRIRSFASAVMTIKRILQLGVILRLIPYNPAHAIVMPRKQIEPSKRIKFIDPKELKTFLHFMEQQALQSFKGFYWVNFYKLLLATGCRYGEAAALEWSDIDLEKRTIRISKNLVQNTQVVDETKTKAGNRTISIDPATANMLKMYRTRQAQTFREVGAPLPCTVFATTLRPYPAHGNSTKVLRQYCATAGISSLVFHAFRHTHASLLLNAGISYKELQHRLGHTNISMTLDIYSHLSEEKEKEAPTYFEKAINSL